jgi:hypothetical protein
MERRNPLPRLSGKRLNCAAEGANRPVVCLRSVMFVLWQRAKSGGNRVFVVGQHIKTIMQALCVCLPLEAHAETTCVFIPTPCPPVGSYNEQIAHLRMQGISEADTKKTTDQAWKMVKDVPGAGITDALAIVIKLSGNGCEELPSRLIGKKIPYPVASTADLRRYPRCQ